MYLAQALNMANIWRNYVLAVTYRLMEHIRKDLLHLGKNNFRKVKLVLLWNKTWF